MYFTHFTEPDDYLVELIECFGFCRVARKNGEDVFVKKLLPEKGIRDPIEISRRFYPSFYDGKLVRKFAVPIHCEYHERLFTDYLVDLYERFILPAYSLKVVYNLS